MTAVVALMLRVGLASVSLAVLTASARDMRQRAKINSVRLRAWLGGERAAGTVILN